MKRILIVGLLTLIVAALAWLGGGAPPHRLAAERAASEAPAPSAVPPPAAAAPRSLEGAPKPTAHARGATTAALRSSSTTATSNEAAGIFGQIQALHQVASQMDVSTYLETNAALAAKHIERFCEEARKTPRPYAPSARSQDAAAFLAPRIDWATEPPIEGTLHVPASITQLLNADGWEEKIADLDLSGLEPRWLSELLPYDYWELTTAGPPSKLGPGADFGAALPLYPFFVHWTKLRFARAFRFGDFLEASREVRHLANLLSTQNVVLAQVIAAVLLKVEERAFLVATRRGLSVPGWAPAGTAEDLDRLRRIDRVSYAFFLPGVSEKVMARALDCAPARCTAITEGAWSHATVGELSSEDTREGFGRIVEDSGCQGPLLAKIREGQKLSLHEAHVQYEGTSPILREFGQ